MHVGINAQLLSFSQNYRNGGVSHYIRSLLAELARKPGKHEYTVFVNGQAVVEQLAARHPQITFVAAPWPESRPSARVAWEQFTLPSLVRRKHIEVLHSPVNVLPELLPRSCAGIVTLHDMAFLRFPSVLTRSKQLYHRTFTVRSLRHATMIIAVSENTKQDAIELLGIAPRRIQTVYPCIGEQFSNVIEQDVLAAFRHKQGLTDGYILYLGTLEPRKNIPTLIEAYARARQAYALKEKLVIAGSKGWLYDSIFAEVQAQGLESEIIFPGYVAAAEQLLWYRAAAAFVYPSLYEGFGLPVAEALACGIPVVTSNVSSLPEAGVGRALRVGPRDVEAMTEAIYRALTDANLRQQCQQLAPEVARQFSAESMVEQIIAVYEQAMTLHKEHSRELHLAAR